MKTPIKIEFTFNSKGFTAEDKEEVIAEGETEDFKFVSSVRNDKEISMLFIRNQCEAQS